MKYIHTKELKEKLYTHVAKYQSEIYTKKIRDSTLDDPTDMNKIFVAHTIGQSKVYIDPQYLKATAPNCIASYLGLYVQIKELIKEEEKNAFKTRVKLLIS